MRNARKGAAYPSADYARATEIERLVYVKAAIFAAITLILLVAFVVAVATGRPTSDLARALEAALLIVSIVLAVALVVRGRHLRRKRERTALLAALQAEIANEA